MMFRSVRTFKKKFSNVTAWLAATTIFASLWANAEIAKFTYEKELMEVSELNLKCMERINEQNDDIKALTNIVAEQRKKLDQIAEATDWLEYQGVATKYAPFENFDGIQAEGDPNCTSIGLHPGPSVLAVDPKKIPYKSEIIVLKDNVVIAHGIAGDTGGALRRNKKVQVDIFASTYKEAMNWGIQDVTILVKPYNKTE